MKLLNRRQTVLFLPLSLWLLGQLFLWQPHLFFIATALGILFIALAAKSLSAGPRKHDWPLFFYFPALLFASASLYETLMPNYYWIQFLLLAVAWLIFIYFKNFYYLIRYEAPERSDKLDTLTMSSGVLSLFFLSSSIFGLPTFLGWSFWPLLFVFAILSAPLLFQAFMIEKLNIKTNWPFFVASVIILTELAAAFYLLPLRFNVLGVVLTIFFYLMLIILRAVVRGQLSSRRLRFPVITGFIVALILMLTARWF